MNPFKMTAWMACPSWLLAAVSPARFERRMVRRACWLFASTIRYGGGRVDHHATRIATAVKIAASPPVPPSLPGLDEPINKLPRATVDGVRTWAKNAAEFLPGRSAKIESLIDHDAPVRAVRDELADGVADVNALEAEVAAKR